MRLQYLKTESLKSFFDCVKKTRECQKLYFKQKTQDQLKKAIGHEKILDQFISDIEKAEGIQTNV